MDKKLEHYCELMVDNRTIFSKTFWLSDYMNIASSVLYTSEEKIADKDNLKNTYKILRKNASLLSVFRANMESLMTAKMSLTEDPLDYFMDIKKIYADLDPNKVFKSEFSVIASMIIKDKVHEEEWRSYINHSKIIYQKMKEEHSVITSAEDIVFATLMAVSNLDEDNLLLEMEENYALLKGKIFGAPNQELSHILSLDLGAPGLKVERFLRLRELMKQNKMNFGSDAELYVLALLSLLDSEDEILVRLIDEVNTYLKIQKGFHGLSMSKKHRLMIAGMIVVKYLKPDDDMASILLEYVCLRNAMIATAAAAAAAA